MNRPGLGLTVSKWREIKIIEKLNMYWYYVKDQGNILLFLDRGFGWAEAFLLGTSETVKSYLSQIFARFGIL